MKTPPVYDINDELEAGKYDGSSPLDTAKYERLVQAIFAGVSRVDAYHENISNKANGETARKACADILKRADVALRLSHLQKQISGLPQPLTRMEAIKTCTDIMRSDKASADNRLKALDRMAKMHGWFDKGVDDPASKNPDPAYFYEFIKRNNDAIASSTICPCCGQKLVPPESDDT